MARRPLWHSAATGRPQPPLHTPAPAPPPLPLQAVSMGTTIMAASFDGGVVMGADSRTSTGSCERCCQAAGRAVRRARPVHLPATAALPGAARAPPPLVLATRSPGCLPACCCLQTWPTA